MAALGTMPWLDSGSKIAKQQVYGIAWWHCLVALVWTSAKFAC